MLKIYIFINFLIVAPFLARAQKVIKPGYTKITPWQNDKKTAISLTYDDNTINQFRVALPIMKKLGFKATFFVITGSVPDSKYRPTFIGPPMKQIIANTAKTPTNKNNFFVRASAIRFSGYSKTYKYHVRAAELYDQGKVKQAYKLIDKVYAKIRSGNLERTSHATEVKNYLDYVLDVKPGTDLVTWNKLKKVADEGYELGSHSVSHSYLSVLDSVNLWYNLTKSREELLNRIGPQATFSAECPFGIDNQRVMKAAHKIYPALRNEMPRPYLTEINRGDDTDPRQSDKKYVQWQRGPLTDTPMRRMKSWVNTSLQRNNIWLVLVFHGVDGIGWQPLTHQELNKYFTYIKKRQDKIWVATFKDVTKYMRERVNGKVKVSEDGPKIDINLTHTLNPVIYNLPLTLKTYVPNDWQTVQVKQGKNIQDAKTKHSQGESFIIYHAKPNSNTIILSNNS